MGFAYIELLISLILNIYIIYLFKKYNYTLIDEEPNKGFNPLDWKVLLVVCAILSFIFHPGTKN